MSHFSTIKTTIKNKPQLIEALELLQYDVEENIKLENILDDLAAGKLNDDITNTLESVVKELTPKYA